MTFDLTAHSDEDLIARLDSELALDTVFSELYRRHRKTVVGWCLKVLRNEQDAADVAQDAFLSVHRELPRFRSDSRFTTWLYVVVRRAALDRLRREQSVRDKATRVAREPEGSSPTPADDVARKQFSDQLRSAMAQLLEPDEAQVIYMHYALGMTLPAITKVLDLQNASGAKAPLVAALRKLRRHYGDDGTPFL